TGKGGRDAYHAATDVFSTRWSLWAMRGAKPRLEFTTIGQTIYNDETSLTVTAKIDHTSASNVNVALRMTGTTAATNFIQLPNPAILTIPAGSLTGSLTIPFSGSLPSGSDSATIYMHRSCQGSIGTVPSQAIHFANAPRPP